MTTRTPIVGGNWKMNMLLGSGTALAEAVAAGCADERGDVEVVLYPPFPYLHAVRDAIGDRPVAVGGQDLHEKPAGAFTGEVSAVMLADVGATAVLVGHSERRHVIGEGDELIRAKLQAALEAGLLTTLCLGETLEQREAGRTSDVILGQLREGLDGLPAARMERVVIAYEPVWAIGTGMTATPEDAQSAHAAIRQALAELYNPAVAEATRIQYGGSVKPSNAATLMAEDDVDGFLVGGASLRGDDFLPIVKAAAVNDPTAAEVRNA